MSFAPDGQSIFVRKANRRISKYEKRKREKKEKCKQENACGGGFWRMMVGSCS